MLIGLKRLGMMKIDCLVLGLPCDDFYNSPTAAKDIFMLSNGTHNVDGNLEVGVRHATVLPQPLGLFHGYYISKPDKNISKILKKAVIIFTDIVYGIVVFVVIENINISIRKVQDEIVKAYALFISIIVQAHILKSQVHT